MKQTSRLYIQSYLNQNIYIFLEVFSLDLFSKHNYVDCGVGQDIQIKLTSRTENCTVKVKPELKNGQVLTWKDHDLGECAYFDVDESSKVLVQTKWNISNFCPSIIELEMSDSSHSSYRSEMEDKVYSYNTNELRHGLVKVWPTAPLTSKSGMNYVPPTKIPLITLIQMGKYLVETDIDVAS